MNRLLSANLICLRKHKFFWIGMSFMFAAGIFFPVNRYLDMKQCGSVNNLDNGFFGCALFIGILTAVFCSLYTGTEYSDGTMRNKIAVGHSRTAVYLSNLAVCAAAGVLACFGYILPMVVTGVPLLGPFTMSVPSLLWFTLCAFIMTAALCAVFAMIAMLNQNKAAVAVICIFLAYFLLFLGIYFNSRLTEPAIIPAREYIESGQILVREAMPNPAYVQGVKRAIFALLYDLPGCQAVQLVAEAEACPVRLPLLSLGAAAVSTGAGLALFRRKDLK